MRTEIVHCEEDCGVLKGYPGKRQLPVIHFNIQMVVFFGGVGGVELSRNNLFLFCLSSQWIKHFRTNGKLWKFVFPFHINPIRPTLKKIGLNM